MTAADEVQSHPMRPRSLRVHDAVLHATQEPLKEGGLPAATVDAMSARSGVSKATIYKHWPSLSDAAEAERIATAALNGLLTR